MTSFTELAGVRTAAVGSGKRVHYSPLNDDTLCGREVSRYLDLYEAVELHEQSGGGLCIPCHRRAEQRAEAARLAATAEAVDAEQQEQPAKSEECDTEEAAEVAVEAVAPAPAAVEGAPCEITIDGPFPGPALIVRGDQVLDGDIVYGAFMSGVTVAEAGAGTAFLHAESYIASPAPHTSCGCLGCGQYADNETAPGITLARITPWDVCDVVPADSPVIIRRTYSAEEIAGTWRDGWIGIHTAPDDHGLFPAVAAAGHRGEQGGLFA
ncbi:hypothetical protein ACFC1B_26995 [Streptomyces xiamenensis]|uniref:hypothetical protein n=1 Tax=Streptomyces xiamenensis TaxID=408015 RepID=UPI0035DF6939